MSQKHILISNLSFSKVSELFFWNATSNFNKSKVTEGTKYTLQLVDTHQQQILGAQVCVVVWESDTERDMRPRQRERGENVDRNSEFMTLVLHTICSLCSHVGRCQNSKSPAFVRVRSAAALSGNGWCFLSCRCRALLLLLLLLLRLWASYDQSFVTLFQI